MKDFRLFDLLTGFAAGLVMAIAFGMDLVWLL